MTDTTTPATDSRLRRCARMQGYALHKSRRQHSLNLGGYMIVDSALNFCVAGEHFDLDASFVEAWLSD